MGLFNNCLFICIFSTCFAAMADDNAKMALSAFKADKSVQAADKKMRSSTTPCKALKASAATVGYSCGDEGCDGSYIVTQTYQCTHHSLPALYKDTLSARVTFDHESGTSPIADVKVLDRDKLIEAIQNL